MYNMRADFIHIHVNNSYKTEIAYNNQIFFTHVECVLYVTHCYYLKLFASLLSKYLNAYSDPTGYSKTEFCKTLIVSGSS